MSVSRGDSAIHVSENRQHFLQNFNISENDLARPVQISRSEVSIVNKPGVYEGYDALITNTPGVYLSILTADCSPILVWSKDQSVVAAIHSGWQGSELNIFGTTLKLILENFEVQPTDLMVSIGPGLSEEYFEVGPEFQQKFKSTYLRKSEVNSRFYFNNNNYLRDTALEAGVPVSQVEILPYCSYQDSELFFSHRRDKGTTGRMMSLIGIKP